MLLNKINNIIASKTGIYKSNKTFCSIKLFNPLIFANEFLNKIIFKIWYKAIKNKLIVNANYFENNFIK